MLRIGVSVNLFPAEAGRSVYPGKALIYSEVAIPRWLMGAKGVTAYLLPMLDNWSDYPDMVADLDGIVLAGGVDVSPMRYGEVPMQPEWSGNQARDAYELALLDAALRLDKPVLGICRGCQLINVACGGTLFQDINTQINGSLMHRDAEIYDRNFHEMTIEAGGKLQRIYRDILRSTINSVHHQAIKDLGKGLRVEARSAVDKIVEAISLVDDSRYLLGVQWHPEWIEEDKSFLSSQPLLADFVTQVAARKR